MRTALDICARVGADASGSANGALAAGVVQALATNLSTVRRKR